MMHILYLIPKNWLSRCVGRLVRARFPFSLNLWLRNKLIRSFKIVVEEAEYPLSAYPTFGAFFVRHLKPGARPLANTNWVSPVDGTWTQSLRLDSLTGPVAKAKGFRFTFDQLAGPGFERDGFLGGRLETLYLAPYNYHRIHSPCAGKLRRARRIPGKLWPVNGWSVSQFPDLFVRNERIILELEVAAGWVWLVLVGATNVGKIRLSHDIPLLGNDPSPNAPLEWISDTGIPIAKGDELGCFEMGSTVLLVMSAAAAANLPPPGPLPRIIRMGEDLFN
jgi:phosphatidylserine decarboxylase